MQMQPQEEWRERELLLELGKKLLESEKHGFPAEPDEVIAAAKHWLARNREKLAALICPNEKIQKLLKKGSKRSEIAAAIADVIAGAVGGLPIFTVARLLVIYGIEALCAGHWSGKD